MILAFLCIPWAVYSENNAGRPITEYGLFITNNDAGFVLSAGGWINNDVLTIVSYSEGYSEGDTEGDRIYGLSLETRAYFDNLWLVSGAIGLDDPYTNKGDSYGVFLTQKVGVDFGGILSFYSGVSLSVYLTESTNMGILYGFSFNWMPSSAFWELAVRVARAYSYGASRSY